MTKTLFLTTHRRNFAAHKIPFFTVESKNRKVYILYNPLWYFEFTRTIMYTVHLLDLESAELELEEHEKLKPYVKKFDLEINIFKNIKKLYFENEC